MKGFDDAWLREYQRRQAQHTAPEPKTGKLSEKEEKILISDYNSYANSGKLQEFSKKMGKNSLYLSRCAKKLGLTDRNRPKDWKTSGLKEVESAFREIHDSFNDRELSEKFGVKICTIVRWRRELGLKKSKEGRWKLTPHPRGALGYSVSPDHREKLISSTKKAWSDPDHKFNTPEHRQYISNRMMEMRANQPESNPYSRCSGGRRKDIDDLYFRSSWEANYARYLNFLVKQKKILKWEYEPDTFIFHEVKRGIRSYKPDFKIWENEFSEPYFVEVKGWMDNRSKTKLKYMEKYYPEIKISIVGQAEYKAIRESIRKIIPGWEDMKK